MMLELRHIYKRYEFQKVLDDVNISFPQCGLISIVGPSGCGKSTLLHIIGGVDKDFQGDILYEGKNMKYHFFRYRHHVSFIFQQFHLIMWLSVKQNITLPRYFQKTLQKKTTLNIQAFENLHMTSLSLGQRQRIAYLRAQFQQSEILLCDEPTGSLDPMHAREVMQLLKEESKHRLVILVSHDLHLVEEFSDEIYEMRDGRIVQHRVIHQKTFESISKKHHRRVLFPHLKMTIMSLMSHKGRFFQLVFGLTISLICIVLTLTMSRGLKSQIENYIYTLVPSSSISFQAKNHQSLSLDITQQLTSLEAITRCQLYLDDYECLGIGFHKEHYQQSQTLFIGDDTAPYDDLKLDLGRMPENVNEVILSLSTAKHLCHQEDVSSLLNQTIYAWYKHDLEVKAISYQIVGISHNTTTFDTLYQQQNAYITLLQEVYQIDSLNSQLGLLYVHPRFTRSEIIKQLEHDYPQYQFMEVGASTTQNVNQTMDRIQYILICFSFLAILSSLFLIGEVMFLNVLQKKKDLAIMRCFGATKLDLICIILNESLLITSSAQIMTTLIYQALLKAVNAFIENELLTKQLIFSFDTDLLLIVYSLSFLLILISQLPPFIYVLKLNTVDALK